MTRALVDTSVLIDFIRGRRTEEVVKFERLVDSDEVLIGDLILCEFLRGFDNEREAKRIQDSMAGFKIVEVCGPIIAVEAARHYRNLRAIGVTVRKTVDVIVGAYCIHHALPLLHNDKDFNPMEEHLGLKVL
jgi:predicted nucleic acid-binding protein